MTPKARRLALGLGLLFLSLSVSIRVHLWLKSLKDPADWLALVHARNRPAGVVAEGLVRVDAQPAVHGREQVGGAQWPADGVLGPGVGRADDLPGAQAAAGEQHRERVAPVVAAGDRDARLAGVDARRA